MGIICGQSVHLTVILPRSIMVLKALKYIFVIRYALNNLYFITILIVLGKGQKIPKENFGVTISPISYLINSFTGS